jgi:aminocarboxymuconate-semialdehyde decarboxylase
MRLDAYTHFFPKKFFDRMMDIAGDFKDMGKRVRALPALFDIDHRKKMVDMYPDYQQILSYPQPPLEVFAPGKEDELSKLINDGFAELIAKERDHFPGWVAHLSLAAPRLRPVSPRRCRQRRRSFQGRSRVFRRAHAPTGETSAPSVGTLESISVAKATPTAIVEA